MARRIQPIFDSVLADTRLQGSSRSFVESLQAQYTRKKTLSPGQRRALGRIEEQLSAACASLDAEQESRLDNLISRATEAKDDWAVTFITSLKGQLLMGRELSPRQEEILAKVETRHSDEARAVRDNWGSSFTSEMREKMVIAARYYLANPPYFNDLAKKAIEDDSFVPSERSYRKMVENKFATKVIESTLSEPKFKAGSHVAARSGAPWQLPRNGTAVVLKVGSKPVTSAARGTKVYTVLFFGSAQPIDAEERWLKKARR
jgi:hypothetical protein